MKSFCIIVMAIFSVLYVVSLALRDKCNNTEEYYPEKEKDSFFKFREVVTSITNFYI